MNSEFGLRSSSLRGGGRMSGVDNDPMASMGNLMDVMLVFACALLVALVVHYNVQLSTDSSVSESAVEKLDGELESGESVPADASSLDAVGTLYRDPATGDLYVLAG